MPQSTHKKRCRKPCCYRKYHFKPHCLRVCNGIESCSLIYLFFPWYRVECFCYWCNCLTTWRILLNSGALWLSYKLYRPIIQYSVEEYLYVSVYLYSRCIKYLLKFDCPPLHHDLYTFLTLLHLLSETMSLCFFSLYSYGKLSLLVIISVRSP